MTVQEKAEKLVNQFRIILMDEDTDCGNEVLCTLIAKQCALIAVDEVLENSHTNVFTKYWQEVKQEIEAL